MSQVAIAMRRGAFRVRLHACELRLEVLGAIEGFDPFLLSIKNEMNSHHDGYRVDLVAYTWMNSRNKKSNYIAMFSIRVV